MSGSNWKRQVYFWGGWLLGATLLTAAVLKALALSGFLGQLRLYGVPAGWIGFTAALLLLCEVTLGLCGVLGVQLRRVGWGTLLLMALFAGATLLRWRALEGTSCGCFGTLSTGGPTAILIQDAVLAGIALLVLAAGRRMKGEKPARPAWRAVVSTLVVFLAVEAARGVAGSSRLGTPAAGDHLRVFLSAGCKHCQESLGKVQALATAKSLPPLKLFIGAESDKQLEGFLRAARPQPQHVPLTLHQLGKEVSQVPTVQVLRDGRLLREWAPLVPDVAAVEQTLRR